MITLIEYPTCSTCKKAKRHLEASGVPFVTRHIVEQCPSKEELRQYWQASNLPLKRFFNTAGKRYQELDLKNRLSEMNEESMLDLLASDGMLIKRPLLVGEDQAVVGYQQEAYDKALSR